MADLCCVYTFAGLTINPTSGDGLFVGENGILGLDGRPIRATIDRRGRTSGAIKHIPAYFAGRVIRFSGPVGIKSVAVTPSTAYFAAVNAVEAAVIAALESKLNTTDTLAWTPSGGAGHTLTCTYGIEGGEIQFTGSMLAKTYSFTLFAETG